MTITRRFQASAELGTGNILLELDTVTNATISNTKAKTGTYSFRISSSQKARKAITATSQMRTAFHINHAGAAAGKTPRIAIIQSDATNIATVYYDIDSATIKLLIGAVEVASAAAGSFVATDTWFHCGIDLKVHGSAGWFYFYVDGVLKASFDGDTDDAGTTVNGIQLASSLTADQWNAAAYYDDFYADDTTGETVPAVLPDRRFTYHLPSGNGTASQFTGSDGDSTDNYLLVDDVPHDSDTTYVKASSTGLRDLYDTQTFTLASGFAISAVIPLLIARKTDAGVATTVKVLAKNGASETLSAENTLGTSYALISERMTTQPNASAWTESAVNATEYGQESAGVYA